MRGNLSLFCVYGIVTQCKSLSFVVCACRNEKKAQFAVNWTFLFNLIFVKTTQKIQPTIGYNSEKLFCMQKKNSRDRLISWISFNWMLIHVFYGTAELSLENIKKSLNFLAIFLIMLIFWTIHFFWIIEQQNVYWSKMSLHKLNIVESWLRKSKEHKSV